MNLTEIEALLERANLPSVIADTHHMQFSAGRYYGFLRHPDELVPVGGVVLGVEGMPQDEGRARLDSIVALVNAAPALIACAKALEDLELAAATYRHERTPAKMTELAQAQAKARSALAMIEPKGG